MAKNNLRSFRFSDEVAAILDRFEGASMNDKFENLILHCFWQREQLEKMIAERQHRLASLEAEIRAKHQQLAECDQLIRMKDKLCASLLDACTAAERLNEGVTQNCPLAPGTGS